MVDEELIKYIKKKLNDGGNTSSEDSLKLLKVYKQVSTENEKLREEFEDMAMLDMSFVGKIIISDENKKFWLEFKEGKVDFGEGDVENPTLTFTTTMNIFSGILYGQIEISSAHKAGDVSFEGSGEELMDFQAITSVLNDFLKYS
jgi:hypothetical protein